MGSNMEWGVNLLEMEIITKVNMLMECLKDLGNMSGVMVVSIKEILSKG